MKVYSSRQQKEPIYREDTGLVCASRANLWRKGLRIGDKVNLLISDLSDINIDIHSKYDFFLTKKTFEYLKKFEPEKLPYVNKII